jgi:hypothetical protein
VGRDRISTGHAISDSRLSARLSKAFGEAAHIVFRSDWRTQYGSALQRLQEVLDSQRAPELPPLRGGQLLAELRQCDCPSEVGLGTPSFNLGIGCRLASQPVGDDVEPLMRTRGKFEPRRFDKPAPAAVRVSVLLDTPQVFKMCLEARNAEVDAGASSIDSEDLCSTTRKRDELCDACDINWSIARSAGLKVAKTCNQKRVIGSQLEAWRAVNKPTKGLARWLRFHPYNSVCTAKFTAFEPEQPLLGGDCNAELMVWVGQARSLPFRA